MDIEYLKNKFSSLYESSSEIFYFFSPCRINLIGDHTDYNGGHVFPCALGFGTYGAVRKRNDSLMKFASGNFSLRVEADINNLIYNEEHGWANYLKGTAFEFIKAGYEIGGLDLYIEGDIPNSAGLSSSASIELLMGAALDKLYDCGMDRIKMIKLCQRAENQYMGMNCGILDQYAVGMGKPDNGLLLDCLKIEHEYVPLDLKGYKLIIANTNTPRNLTNSEYNTRRTACERSLADLRSGLAINYLCELSESEFELNKWLIKNDTARKRAEHVVFENARTLKAVDKLKAGDLFSFGRLMNESHISLRDLFEVTIPNLDIMVETAWGIQGVLGSRMTGGGFGGCTISLVKEENAEEFIALSEGVYYKRTGLMPSFYIAAIGGGTREIS